MKNLLAALAIIFTSHFAHAAYDAEADILNNKGDKIGTAQFKQGTEGVVMRVQVKGLKPGVHGMHFHEVGDCSDHEHFKNAKGHIAPTGKPHGYFNPGGPHAGNLPNLIVGKNGDAHVELYSNLVSLKKDKRNLPSLLDEDGSTLMIHEDEDDHMTQPIGNSGARQACGVIRIAVEKTAMFWED